MFLILAALKVGQSNGWYLVVLSELYLINYVELKYGTVVEIYKETFLRSDNMEEVFWDEKLYISDKGLLMQCL